MIASIPQDEGIYFGDAVNLNNQLQPFDYLKHCPVATGIVNPIFLIHSRYLYNLLSYLVLLLSGDFVVTVSAVSVMAFMLGNLWCWVKLAKTFSPRIAVITLILLMTTPVYLLQATRMTPDMLMSVLLMISYLHFLAFCRSGHLANGDGFYAGLFFGLAYVVKEPAIVALKPVFFYLTLVYRKNGKYFFPDC